MNNIKSASALKFCFDIAKAHMNTIGWKVQSDEVDDAIGHLSPAQIANAVEGDLHKHWIYADLIQYLAIFHETWLVDTTWAFPDLAEPETRPDNYDPTLPLNVAKIWEFGDRV